jgi:uncharacterized membrane protein YphA (DoxX/SURF4 family)
MGNEAAVISRVLVQPSERTGQLANTDILFKTGRVFFGLAIVAFGIQSLFYAHSANPHLIGPPFFPGRLLWAWIAGAIFCAGGVSIAANTNVRLMAALVGVVMAARIVFIHAPMLATNLHDPGPWTSGFEIVGICSGAWALVAHSSAGGRLKQSLMIAVRIGLASLLVVVGVQHFMYAQFVATLVQPWMPWHLFWANFIGVAFFATALALVTGILARLATAMLGLMFFLFVFSLHLPRVVAASHNGNEWTSMFVAAAMCGTAWILAGSLGKNAYTRR